MTKKKLRLKSSAKKPLIIIGAIILVIIIIISFYFNRIGELKNLGYSEESAKSIIFKFKYSYVMDIGENKTLDKAFSSDDYRNENLDSYTKINYEEGEHLISNINKFGITPAMLNHVKKFTCKKYIIRKATNINKIDTAFFIIALLSLI